MNHSARYIASIAFRVSLTCYKTSFEKRLHSSNEICHLELFSTHYLLFFFPLKYFLLIRKRVLVTKDDNKVS